LQITDYSYPKLKIITEVSSGTYIRSLAEDIGEKLGTGAYLSTLRRTKIDKFDVVSALSLEKINLHSIQEHLLLLQ
jgi:tRNA pseudouridine55 synthase